MNRTIGQVKYELKKFKESAICSIENEHNYHIVNATKRRLNLEMSLIRNKVEYEDHEQGFLITVDGEKYVITAKNKWRNESNYNWYIYRDIQYLLSVVRRKYPMHENPYSTERYKELKEYFKKVEFVENKSLNAGYLCDDIIFVSKQSNTFRLKGKAKAYIFKNIKRLYYDVAMPLKNYVPIEKVQRMCKFETNKMLFMDVLHKYYLDFILQVMDKGVSNDEAKRMHISTFIEWVENQKQETLFTKEMGDI
jgi:hypothetical protein